MFCEMLTYVQLEDTPSLANIPAPRIATPLEILIWIAGVGFILVQSKVQIINDAISCSHGRVAIIHLAGCRLCPANTWLAGTNNLY
jgi:hypothetical protein